jgi:glycosyltransferase involved in cell wall biosynthesis
MRSEVFILTPEPPERPGGGMERSVSYIGAGLEERGYGVRVFHRENCAPPRWRRPEPSRKAKWLLAGFLQGYYIGRAARKALHPGVRLILSNSTVGWFPLGDDVKQVHFYHGTYWGQAEAIRSFITRRGYLKLKWWDAMVLERWSGRGKLCLCNSDQTRAEVKRLFGYDCVTIWNPLDVDHFRPLDKGQCRRGLGLPESKPVGLFVGSAHPMKGFPTVQVLMDGFPQVQWVIALRGEVPEALWRASRVKVFQNVTYEELPILYSAADFSLCPSRYEPFGYVVAEALACGTPVIATPGGASRLLLSKPPLDKFLVASPDDQAAFAKAISDVLVDPDSYRQAVLNQVRPMLEEVMAPKNWWCRFLSVTGLSGNG